MLKDISICKAFLLGDLESCNIDAYESSQLFCFSMYI